MALNYFFIKVKKVTVIQNYSIAIRLFYANFEIYKLYTLFAFIAFANLICLIVNQSIEI